MARVLVVERSARMPAAFKLRNRSLKSELIFMDSSRGRGRHHKVPGGFKDLSRTKLLPERNIEFASGSPALYQPAHDHSVGHMLILCEEFQPRVNTEEL